jgi:ketosteroid isomerase-like protein
MRREIGVLLLLGIAAGCASSTNVSQEREALMRTDHEWSGTVKDPDKFVSYYAADASFYPQGMSVAKGTTAIREAFAKISSAPGFALQFAATKADVSASGDLGYTAGTYEASMAGATEKGKYVTTWKKQQDGKWKVIEDIFNADSSGPPPTAHVAVDAPAIKYGDAPPSLPAGAKAAIIAGDPSKPVPYILRLQAPAGYKIGPHWHPTDENVTVLSGTAALGMGDTWDDSKLQSAGPGGVVVLPADMHHYFVAKTAVTVQVHGIGPFAITYVNAADDPRKK